MAMKKYSTLSKSPELEPQHQMHPFGGDDLTPVQGVQSAYSKPCLLGRERERDRQTDRQRQRDRDRDRETETERMGTVRRNKFSLAQPVARNFTIFQKF